jgi:hypothetical protein
MSETMQQVLRRRKRWSTVFVVVGLVLAIGPRFAVLPFLASMARLLGDLRIHFPRGTVFAVSAAGVGLALYGYLRPLRCPMCGKAMVVSEEDGDDVPGFCPHCEANLHKPMPEGPSSPIR